VLKRCGTLQKIAKSQNALFNYGIWQKFRIIV
jgi:hypothetical protein